MQQLFEIQNLIVKQAMQTVYYNRNILEEIDENIRVLGLVGMRGVGKTTYLVHHAVAAGALEGKALYVSADSLYFLENKLIDLVDRLYKETSIRVLCIDEIHKYSNWNQELKNIIDIYSEMKIRFTGSSAIDIIHSKYDLSRRVILINLPGLSFREYLAFYCNYNFPKLEFADITARHIELSHELEIQAILKHLYDYFRIGYYPFFQEYNNDVNKYQAVEHVVQKTIYEDIATLHTLKTPSLQVMEKLYKYSLNSLPGELSAYKLANALQKDYESVVLYLQYLEHAGLLRTLYAKKTGKAFLRKPDKIYPNNTNLIYASLIPQLQESSIGKVRELFVLQHCQNASLPIYYSRVGDFIVDDMIIAVGGRNKTKQQIKDVENGIVLADGILIGEKNRIPLFWMGFIY